MRCDDGTAINLLGMTHHLIDIGQGIGYSQLIAVAPDDTTCKEPTPAHKTYLAQSLNAFIGEEQAIEVIGIGLANHIEIALEPGLIDAGMGEEVLLGTNSLLVGQFEPMAISVEAMKGFCLTIIITITQAHIMIVKREVMHIVVAQQEDNLIGMTIAEGDNVNQTLHGCGPVDVLIGIGIDIIPQEDNLGVFA